jgi:flagellar biosynthesis regulator FlaF
MQNVSQAAHAYQAAASYRSQREQEADVFRRISGALKAAREAGANQRVQAIADNRRLWITLADLMRDPLNQLPQNLRASIVSVGITVQRDGTRRA